VGDRGAVAPPSSNDREDNEDNDEEEKDSFKFMSSAHGLPALGRLVAPPAHGGSDDDEEEDDDVSLSEDSVYLRMTEHDTPRVIEEVFRRMPTALNLVDSKTVNKQFFTGHARTTNEEIFFRGDITTPALRGAMSAAASKAAAEIDLRSRQAACTQQFKLGSHVTPVESGPGAADADPWLTLALLQRRHNASEVERKRAHHKNGKNMEQILPPRPVEARELMRNVAPSTIDQLASPRAIAEKPLSPETRSRPLSAVGTSSSRPSSAVQPKAPDGSKPSNQRKRVSKDASFSKLSDTPDLPTYSDPTQPHMTASPNAILRPKIAPKAFLSLDIDSSMSASTSASSSSGDLAPARSPTATQRNAQLVSMTNIVPAGSWISSPIGYSKHARRNFAYIISLVHGYQEVKEESDSDSEEEEEEAEWDADGLINGNLPIDSTAEGKKKHWKHRRVIMGPTVGSAEENEMRAKGTWKEEGVYVRPKRATALSRQTISGSRSRVRADTKDSAALEALVEEAEDTDAQKSLGEEAGFDDEGSNEDEQDERMRVEAEKVAMNKRLQFREDYLAYKKALINADDMKPFAWLNTATSRLDNTTLSMKLPLHAIEGGRKLLPRSPEHKDLAEPNRAQPAELHKPIVHYNKHDTETVGSMRHVKEKDPESVYAVSHGAFQQFDTENTRQAILDPNDELLQNDHSTDRKGVINSAKPTKTTEPPLVRLYDEYYDNLYAGVLDKLLLRGESHKVTHLHTHLSKLDAPHQISVKPGKTPANVVLRSKSPPHSPIAATSSRRLGKSPEKGSPSVVGEDAAPTVATKPAQIDSRKLLQAKIAAMEREILLPSSLKDNEKEENGPHPVLGTDATSPVSRKQLFEVSKATVAKAEEPLKALIAQAPAHVVPSPRVAPLRPKPIRERSAMDPPVLPAGVRIPVIQTQHKRRWNQFSFITPDMEAMSGLDVAALMEVLLQSHNSQQQKDDAGKRRDSIIGVPDAAVGKSRPNTRVLSSELMQLFTGFSKMDSNGDGLLSADDMNEFVANNNAEVQLPLHVLQEIIYAQDDAQRGALTFDAVQSYYMRLRPVLNEQLHIWKKMAGGGSILQKRKGKENSKNVPTDSDVNPPANIQLPFLQLLLYRLLVFASFIDDDGKVKPLTAFQQFVEQYGTEAADRAFELVFLRKASEVKEGDGLHLSGFVSHVRAHSIESTFRPSIFEPPVLRAAKTLTEMMQQKPSQPTAVDK